jgi:hypothetical protein
MMSLKLMLLLSFLMILCYVVTGVSGNIETIELANGFLPMLLIVGCGLTVLGAIRDDPVFILGAVSWFIFACGVCFGGGPLIYFYGNADSVRHLDSLFHVRDELLLRTNLLNAVGIFMVCLGYVMMSRNYLSNMSNKNEQYIFDYRAVSRFTIVILAFSVPVRCLVLLNSYLDAGWAIPSSLAQTGRLTLVCLFLVSYLYFKAMKSLRILAFSLLIFEMGLALPTYSKSGVLVPLVVCLLAAFLATRKKTILLVGAAVVVLFFSWYKPLSDLGRSKNFDTFGDSISFVWDYMVFDSNDSIDYSDRTTQALWTRLSFSNVQGYIMSEYDSGAGLGSMDRLAIVFVPRILWKDKPSTTNVGLDLYKRKTGNEGSSLAPTVFGDLYGSGGWLLVISASLFIGVVLAILSHKTYYYWRNNDIRYLPIIFLGIGYGSSVESPFVPTFVGSLPLMAGTWYLIKTFVPLPLKLAKSVQDGQVSNTIHHFCHTDVDSHSISLPHTPPG